MFWLFNVPNLISLSIAEQLLKEEKLISYIDWSL